MLITRSLATVPFITLIALMVVPGYSAIGMEVQKSSDMIMSPKITTHPNKQVIEKMQFAVLSDSDHKISYFEMNLCLIMVLCSLSW